MRKIFPELIQPRASSDEWLWKRKVGRNPQSDQKQLFWRPTLTTCSTWGRCTWREQGPVWHGSCAGTALSEFPQEREEAPPQSAGDPHTGHNPAPISRLRSANHRMIRWTCDIIWSSEVRQQNWISNRWTCDRGSLFLISLRWAESEAIIDCSDMVSNKGIWRSEQRTTKMKTSTTILLLLCLIGMTSSQSGIRILPDGGYSDIVVRIADSVDQDYCSQYIKHLTVSFSSPTCLSPSHLRSPTNPSLSVSSSPSIHSHKPLFFISFFLFDLDLFMNLQRKSAKSLPMKTCLAS